MNNQKYIILGLTPQGLALLRVLAKAGADVTAFCLLSEMLVTIVAMEKKFVTIIWQS